MELKGKARHMYPGNNTPEGFFSYYNYILSQREADKIICIKGGPGVGKSTFMKKIAEELLEDGYNIDFMHCSSDNNSLDGIVLRDKKIAMVDGTSPHVVVA
ncbi:nSTAND3 domain-containing NTPase [Anaerovorax odorimutans]|uniref:nSTAND3 domain-containing NTPase n=1 Tax=Anaerovorax odorimutans TaxID=109327 RepID=UPI000400876F|nr:nucleoside-triphosphatase [Anaerovorax odorimutans]